MEQMESMVLMEQLVLQVLQEVKVLLALMAQME